MIVGTEQHWARAETDKASADGKRLVALTRRGLAVLIALIVVWHGASVVFRLLYDWAVR